MRHNLNIIFLVNSTSNKSKAALEGFASEWPFPSDVGCVSDGEQGEAADEVGRQGFPVKICADTEGQTEAVKAIRDEIGGCDYLISIGWSHKVPSDALNIPEKAALNVHSSYLPDYRGLSVHRAQWANAEPTGGVTVHRMTDEFDKGAIIAQERYKIALWDTPLDMMYKIGELSSILVREAVLRIESGFEGEKQEDRGEYHTIHPWREVLIHGVVNHAARAIGIYHRWKI